MEDKLHLQKLFFPGSATATKKNKPDSQTEPGS